MMNDEHMTDDEYARLSALVKAEAKRREKLEEEKREARRQRKIDDWRRKGIEAGCFCLLDGKTLLRERKGFFRITDEQIVYVMDVVDTGHAHIAWTDSDMTRVPLEWLSPFTPPR